jgi:hypothetical protein
MTEERVVTLEINQQQAQMLDRLIAEGVGSTPAEVIRAGFLRFCVDHPEFASSSDVKTEASS